MLPHHKDWALKRSLRRIKKFAKGGERMKLRGRTPAQIAEHAAFIQLGIDVSEVFNRLDVRIVDIKATDDRQPFCSFEFRCLECGSSKVRIPDDGSDEGMCSCSACGNSITSYKGLTEGLRWLALDEWRYGEPEKFRRVSPLSAEADGR